MTDQIPAKQNESSLFDIFVFFKKGWKTIFGCSFVGLLVGVVVAFVLPEKFQASALIEPASVAVRMYQNDALTRQSPALTRQIVELPAVLAEKMKQPSYYSLETIKACAYHAEDISPQVLVNRLRPTVARNSTYVSISYLASSPLAASACLEAVLNDVVMNQVRLSEPFINKLQVELSNAEQELKAVTTERDQQRIKNQEKLLVVQSKLKAAEKFVEQFTKDSFDFRFDDPQFSASVLLISTLLAMKNEIKDLQLEINSLEMEIAANMTDKDQAVRKMTNTVSELKNALLPPTTKDASFAAPIYASNWKVEPKRPVVIAVGLLIGFLLAVLVLFLRRVKTT